MPRPIDGVSGKESRPSWLSVAALASVAALSSFLGLGRAPLFDLDEGAYAEVAREMLVRHDLIGMFMNGAPFYEKPPLLYWLQAASWHLVGPTEFAIRLPSALAGITWALCMAWFVARRLDARTGLWAGLIVSTAIGCQLVAHAAIMDAILDLCLGLAFFELWSFFETRRQRPLIGAWLWISIGVLDKGPIAAVLPLCSAVLFLAWERRLAEIRSVLLAPGGLLLFASIALPWYVLEADQVGRPFIDTFFLQQNLERFTGTLQGHGGSFLYYVPVVLLVLMPYAGLALQVLWRGLTPHPRDSFERWCWSWFALVFVILSVAQTKLPHYILYATTPLIVLMARDRDRLMSRTLALLPAALFVGLAFMLPEVLDAILTRSASRELESLWTGLVDVFDPWYRVAALLLGIILASLAFAPLKPAQVLLGFGLAQSIFVGTVLWPHAGELQQGPVKRAALFARSLTEPVFGYRIRMPSFSVYRQAVTTDTEHPQPRQIVLSRADHLRELPAYQVLWHDRGLFIVRIDGMR
jgi:4-amino-4-deoxy-L-arabinose transferase-like glycosyltransferase